MKKLASKFPHIYRVLTATLLLTFLAVNFYSRLPTGFLNLEGAKLVVMLNPNDISSHLLLTQAYLEQGDMEAVKRELTLAENLNSQPKIYNSQLSSVLGTSLSPLKIWQKIQNEPQRIKEEIVFWEKTVADKPNYRDAYLQLAILNYQIYENQKAKEYLNKALEIDPNFEVTKELGKIIQ